ncbi:MAG: hypothetical protein AAGJ55_07140, partial [Cyanobacteria bacterium J06555_12]
SVTDAMLAAVPKRYRPQQVTCYACSGFLSPYFHRFVRTADPSILIPVPIPALAARMIPVPPVLYVLTRVPKRISIPVLDPLAREPPNGGTR